MIIRQLLPSDCFRAMGLWQSVFHDSQPFASFYFANRFCASLSFGAFDEERLVSMALGRPVPLDHPSYKTIFIAGVCTLPEYRRQGLMREILTRLLSNAVRQGIELALLSPAIPNLYDAFGFVPLSYALRVEETADGDRLPDAVTPATDLLAPMMVYRAVARRHPLMLARDEKAFQRTMQEYAKDHGIMLQTRDRMGYLCFLPGEEGIEVTECVALRPDQYRVLLRAAAVLSPTKKASAELPADCGLSGTLVRPVYGLALKPSVPIQRLQQDRKTFLVERY